MSASDVHPYDHVCRTCGAGTDTPCRVQTRHGVIDGAHPTRVIPPAVTEEAPDARA